LFYRFFDVLADGFPQALGRVVTGETTADDHDSHGSPSGPDIGRPGVTRGHDRETGGVDLGRQARTVGGLAVVQTHVLGQRPCTPR